MQLLNILTLLSNNLSSAMPLFEKNTEIVSNNGWFPGKLLENDANDS